MKVRHPFVILVLLSIAVLWTRTYVQERSLQDDEADDQRSSVGSPIDPSPFNSADSPAMNLHPPMSIHWPEIAGNDLPSYVANLRLAGCPEATVRDIIVGVVDRHFRPRLAALLQEAEPYWQTLDRRSGSGLAEQERRGDALLKERADLIHRLLGIRVEDYLAERSFKPDAIECSLGGISEARRPVARQVLHQYSGLEQAVVRRCGGTLGLSEQAELRRLYDEKLATLKSLLTLAELEEFELRASPLALRLRSADLIGFAPSEAEFRAIFRIASEAEQSAGGLAGDTSPLSEDKLRAALGDKRFRDYKRSQDLTYRRLVEFASCHGLEAEVATQVHEMREAVLRHVDQLAIDLPAGSLAQLAALQETQMESIRAVRELLGEHAFDRYQEVSIGRWINLVPTWTNGVVFRD